MMNDEAPVFSTVVSFMDRFLIRLFPLSVGGILVATVLGKASVFLGTGVVIIAALWALKDLSQGIRLDHGTTRGMREKPDRSPQEADMAEDILEEYPEPPDGVMETLKTWQEFDEAEEAGMSKEELREEFEEELGWFDCVACDWHGATAPMAEDWSVDRIVECPECGSEVE